MYKIVLREDLAIEDGKGIGYEYEIREVVNNPERVKVCFEDDNGNLRELRYRKEEVDGFIENGEWIIVTT